MIVLDHIGVHLPQGYLFKDVSLQINKNDRIGLVGKNGAGKSTLLKLIAGVDQPAEGTIHKPKETTIGFLTQDIVVDSELSVFEYLNQSNKRITDIRDKITDINDALVTRTDYESEGYLELLNNLDTYNHEFNLVEGYLWEEKIASVLKGLGFNSSEYGMPLNTFSGGWKMRAELAKLLVNNPDILLLDEPTNHLDIISIGWLEEYLKTFPGAVLLISHDRLFLDNVTKRTLEISNGKVFDFMYAYSKYKTLREEELLRLGSAKKQQDKEIKHTQELINKFRAKKNKAAFAQSLIKKLEKTERIEIESNDVSKLNLTFPLSVQPGKWVLEMDEVEKSYDDKLIFKGITTTVGRGEKIALLGANGTGKSTLLKRVMNKIDGQGTIKLGHNVNIGYFAQDQAESLDVKKTVLQTVDEIAKGEIRNNLRGILGAFLFSGEDVDKYVGVLSGGERTRLALCQLLLSPSNFLILDEPTNHLDLQSKEVLKSALKNYEGTFVVVSHDREFLDGLTNRIWEIDDHALKIHHDGVKEFLNRKLTDVPLDKPAKKIDEPSRNKSSKNDYEEKKELKRKLNKLKNQIYRAETRIEELESEIKSVDELIAELNYDDKDNAEKVLGRYNDLKSELDTVMSKWEEATEEQLKLED